MHAHLDDSPTSTSATPPRAHCLLRPIDGGPVRQLSLWDDRDAAEAQRTRAGGGRVYEVEDLQGRPADAATSAAVVEFDGPRDAAQVAADRRANRERVWPAASQVDGVHGAVVLRAPDDGAMLVVALAASREALEASSRAILSTPLLPGEDATALRGPDRYTTCTVTDAGVARLLDSDAAVPVR